jgi:O-succinylbenzoate synthase
MKIEAITLHHISMPLVHPFRTSFGVEEERPCIIVEVRSEGLTGWGECVAMEGPWYSAETTTTAWHILTQFLCPMLIGNEIATPADANRLIKRVRGNPMARAGIENALWDLFAKAQGVPLSQLLGGVRSRVPVGVSIGIQPTIDALAKRVASFVELGYGRVKCKIEPDWTYEPLARIRADFPDALLMADANSAFTLADAPMLRELDALNLLMIEQPLGYDDIADHARLQRELTTPICLDESIHAIADAQAMIDLQAGRIINMKQGRVGGVSIALQIHDMAQAAGIAMWCGGMLETGIGRSLNIHLATLPNFTLPGDISATDRYYAEDITDHFVLNADDSTMSVPTGPGIGVTVRRDRLAAVRLNIETFTI